MKRLFLLLFAGLFVWGACVREDQTEIPPVDPKEKPTPNPTPTPPVLFTLEAATAKASDYVVGKKLIVHGFITVKNKRAYFKFSDGTLVQIFTPKFKELSEETSKKLQKEGQEVSVTGTFTDYTLPKGDVVKEIVYQNETDLVFGEGTPTPEEIPSLEASQISMTDFTAYFDKKVKLHGSIAEVEGNRSFVKLSDGTLVQVFTHKFKELSEDHFPSTPGVYVIRIDNIKALPSVISEELKKRKHNILYIGIASKSIRKRLWKQELHFKGAATFFRSIGAILGYRPKPNSLSPSSYNYKFSTEDKYNIISWIESHLLVDFVESNENLKEVESELIKEFIPVVNIVKNPYRLEYVSSSRKECIDIAHGT